MALTIRSIDEEQRQALDLVKELFSIKTDSRALVISPVLVRDLQSHVDESDKKIEKLQLELDDYKRIMAGLEKYLAPALESIRQSELQL